MKTWAVPFSSVFIYTQSFVVRGKRLCGCQGVVKTGHSFGVA